MRHGWLWLISLFCCFSLLSFTSSAQALLSVEQRDQWLANPQLADKVDELYYLVERDEVASLESQLQGLAFPQQEAIRYLLLLRCQQTHVTLSLSMEQFITKQRLLAPQYQIVEKGRGFEFYSPAFDYPAVANRLIKFSQNRRDLSSLRYSIIQNELNIKVWLSGDAEQADQHQVLLLDILPSLTGEQIQFLVDQIKQQGVISWLPSNQVMVELAKLSQDPELYKLLWLKRADLYVEREVARLAKLADPSAIHNLLLASHNPRLRPQVQSALSKVFPMPESVSEFFIEQLQYQDQVSFVSQLLIEQGYRHWLEELVQTHPQVQKKLIGIELAR